MKDARDAAHDFICTRQEHVWCHWSSDRTVHSHYCDSLTALIASRDSNPIIADLLTALDRAGRYVYPDGTVECGACGQAIERCDAGEGYAEADHCPGPVARTAATKARAALAGREA
jgi:hypothetical protein